MSLSSRVKIGSDKLQSTDGTYYSLISQGEIRAIGAGGGVIRHDSFLTNLTVAGAAVNYSILEADASTTPLKPGQLLKVRLAALASGGTAVVRSNPTVATAGTTPNVITALGSPCNQVTLAAGGNAVTEAGAFVIYKYLGGNRWVVVDFSGTVTFA